MKKLITIAVLFSIQLRLFAQCDIAQKLVSVTPASIAIGQTANMKFSITNAGTGVCSYKANSLEVILSLPSEGYSYRSIVSPAGGIGAYFNWTYNSAANVVIGKNHTALPIGAGENDITIQVEGVAVKKAQSNLNINIFKGGTNLSTANDPALFDLEVTAAGPLPVRLVTFVGKQITAGNELTWVTSSELNFSHFEVEKSKNAKSFVNIAKVLGKGNSKEKIQYNYIDSNISAGMIPGANTKPNFSEPAYYRLKLVDLDGSTGYSNIIFIDSENNSKSVVGEFYPNPSNGKEVSINILSTENKDWLVTSYDVTGKILSINNHILKTGDNVLKVSVQENANGVLFYRLENAEGIHIRKINKN